jgi:hypothetical protein
MLNMEKPDEIAHMLNMEKPDETNRLIIEFLAKQIGNYQV